MKVLFITPRFYPRIGGVEKHSFEVARRLVELGHEVTVVTEAASVSLERIYHLDTKSATEAKKNKRPVKSIQTETKIQVVSFYFGKKSKLKKFKIWLKLIKHSLFINQFDIIHVHDVFVWYLPLRFLLPFKKVFITFHGYEGSFPPGRRAILIRKLSEKLARGNFCVGRYIRKWYGTKYDKEIYGGVEFPVTKKKIKYSKSNRRVKIAFIGRLSQDTGVKTYVQALRLAKEAGIKFDFEACGDGPLRKTFGDYGKVRGFVKDVDKSIQRSDLIFASSYLSILESLALKKKVIATFDNPLKEDYLKCSPFKSYIIIENDPQNIASEIERIYKGRSLKLRDPQKFVKSKSWDKITSDYLQLWKK